MPNQSETTMPDAPTTGHGLPPGGSAAPTARAEPRRVPGPGEPRSLEPRAGQPEGPSEMREEIARTRARLSHTLDALEARVVDERQSLERKKDELVDRATLKPLRKRLAREPWRSMAIAFVAGYVVAALRD